MTDNDETLMTKYGVTQTTTTVYHYQQYSYNKLRDALNFAEIDTKRRDSQTEKPK